MREPTISRLLTLNRNFYASVAEYFDATRQGWTPGLLTILPYFQVAPKQKPVSVLDVGCGNGRLARLLDEHQINCQYVGVDASASLLTAAMEATADLQYVRAAFHQADVARKNWWKPLAARPFDRVVCTATIQHIPGYPLRLRLLRDFRRLSKELIILSFWQFLSSERFTEKTLDWSRAGLSDQDVDDGDALLPWKKGVSAIRYVHQVDQKELQKLAADAGLTVQRTFRADGKEGNLNLYAVLSVVGD